MRSIKLASLTWLGLWLLARPAGAQLFVSGTPSNSYPYQVSLTNGEFIGGRDGWQVQRAFLTTGTNTYMFVVPDGFRMDASNPQQIVLSDLRQTCFITVYLPDAAKPAETKESQAGVCRKLALARFADATLSNECLVFALERSGPAFDLELTNRSGVKELARDAFIPTACGNLEFVLLARPGKFQEGSSILTALLASVRSNEAGPLEIVPICDHP